MTSRVLAVGLHGCGSYYLEPLFAQGRLPNLRRFLDQASSRTLRSVLPISAAAWATILTGKSPGEHGALDYVKIDATLYRGTDGELSPVSELWESSLFTILSRQGRRVACLFWPMTYPPGEINGVVISGTPMPDECRPATFPPELGAELGRYCDRPMLSLRYEDRAGIERYLEQTTRFVRDHTIRLWREGGFDLLATCFASPEVGHHYFWARDDAAAMERIYRGYDRVDEALGELLAAASDADVVVLFSDHGGASAPNRIFSVSRWLADEGYLALHAPRVAGPLAGVANRMVQLGRRYRLNERWRKRIRGRLRRAVLSVTRNELFADWGRSRAYAVDFGYPTAGVEINLRGRQEQGIVAPGDEYESLRREIAARLEALVDPETGARVCRRVHRREELFHGPFLERFPDLIAVLDPDFDAKVQLQPRPTGPNELSWEYPYMGYHGLDGILAVRGPGVRVGQRLAAAEMVDFAPTLLALAGSPIPATMEGNPLAV